VGTNRFREEIMALKWYTYHSHPHKEQMLFHQLECHELEGFYPCLNVTPKNPRCRTSRPYFPGYLFIHVDLNEIHFSTLQNMPYSNGLVEFGGEPAVVPDDLIISIQNRMEALNAEEIKKENKIFKPGDLVVVANGLLEGYEALFDQSLTGKERSLILIKTLYNHSIRIEIPNKLISKK
jgi:transcription antitermination factor NusG